MSKLLGDENITYMYLELVQIFVVSAWSKVAWKKRNTYMLFPERTTSEAIFLSLGQMDSQVNASQRKIANQNLRTDLRRMAKRIRKSARKSQKNCKFHAHWLMRFYNNRLLAINLCQLALGV